MEQEDILEQLFTDLNISTSIQELIRDKDDKFELRFEKPDDLNKRFSILEEDNLFLILRCQESELQLEDKKQKFYDQKKEFEKALKQLRENEEDVNQRIGKTVQEKEALFTITEDVDGKSLDPNKQKEL